MARRPVSLEVEVAFNTVYAARQHEELDWQHPLGGQAKYLEQPFRELLPRYERLIAQAVQAVTPEQGMGGGLGGGTAGDWGF